MKVYNTETYGYSNRAIESFKEMGLEYEGGDWDSLLNGVKRADIDILIVRLKKKVDANVLNKLPKLSYIISATTGQDHIDVTELDKRGIQLITLRGEDDFLGTIPSTAEHTWALMMALIRNICPANQDVFSGNWDRDQFRGYQLKGKNLGIVGYGRTGSKVGEYGMSFGMNVSYYDPFKECSKANKVESLERLMMKSDILTFHVHLDKTTKMLLNQDNIAFLKKGVFLINTSRGGVWDEQAISNSFETDQVIKGVAVDVLTNELHNLKSSPIWESQKKGHNIIITPHIGGASWDAMWDCENFMVKKLQKTLENKPKN